VAYDDLVQIDGLGQDWVRTHDGTLQNTDRLRVAAYHDLLERGEARHFSTVNRGIRGFKARQNLAVVYSDLGDFGRAEEPWRRVVEAMPSYRAGWQGLGEVLLRQMKLTGALHLADQMLKQPSLGIQGRIMKGRVAARQESAETRREVEQAVHL
jgi:hypothetical protein